MPGKYIFVTTQSIGESSLQDQLEPAPAYAQFRQASEPDLIDFHIYTDRERTEMTLVFVFADAQVAEAHMRVARETLGRGVEIELDGDLNTALSMASSALAQQARGLRRAATHRPSVAAWPPRAGGHVERNLGSPWRDLDRRLVQGARR